MKKKIGMVVFVLIIINVLAVILFTMHKETAKVEKTDTASKQEMVKNEGKAYASHYQLQVSLDTQNKVLSGTVCATLKNATDEDLKKICVRNWAAAILKGKKFKTEISSAKIGKENLQIDKKEDASIVYLSAANRIIAPARSLSLIHI